MDEKKKQAQDERSCQNCVNKCPVNIGPNYRCSQWQPKAQEQGGEDRLPMPPTDIIEASEKVADWCSMQCRGGWQLGKVESRDYSRKDLNDLRARLDDEKKRRVYYQGIVYDVMNSMSNGKMVCGTVDEPSTQVQDGVRLVLKHRNEFEQEAMNLRARLARAESNVAKMTNALATGNKITIVTEEYAAVVARLALLEKENAELKRQKEAWRDEFIILNDVMRDVSACNAYDDDEISRIDKSEVKV